MRQKLHEDDKRKRVNVLLSNNERELLKEKMDKYGYADLSSYLRDAGIYERLYLEDIDGKKEISELVSNMIGEIRKYLFEQNKILMKQSNQEQVRAEQNRQRDAEQNRKLISELKQSVELLKNSNELLQDAISGEIGSLKDEVKENTVQEVRKALQANIEAIQRATKLLEKQSDTLTSVMKQKIRELEESKNSFFRYEGLKLYLFWGGMVCNILVFLMLLSSCLLR